jgi:hypothetical protein
MKRKKKGAKKRRNRMAENLKPCLDKNFSQKHTVTNKKLIT